MARFLKLRPFLLLLSAASIAACAESPVTRTGDAAAPALPALEPPKPLDAATLAALAERKSSRACAERIARAMQSPSQGAPGFEKKRAQIYLHSKAEPVIWVRPPTAPENTDEVVARERKALRTTGYAFREVGSARRRHRHDKATLRAIVLTEGYVYAETPGLAYALTRRLRFQDLFAEPTLVVERGSTELLIEKNKKHGYVYASGPQRGRPAQLLFLDRVRLPSDMPRAPLHRGLRDLQNATGFERIRAKHVSETAIVADLVYGGIAVETLLESEGSKLSVGCEVTEPVGAAVVRKAHADGRDHARYVNQLRASIDAQIDDQLPFDEPRNEVGQQDGELMKAWLKAYRKKERRYEFNEDQYAVFNRSGAPLIPQVCIDFVTHTFERASGTWYRPRGQKPGREVGGLDFSALIEGSRRQVPRFLNFVRAHPEFFDLHDIPSRHQVPYEKRGRFYRHLEKHADWYEVGDVLIIRGLVPWDEEEKQHYHSLFIYDQDPVTGVPTLTAGNAGLPQVRGWEPEMSRAPERTIRHVIRPRLEWLRHLEAEQTLQLAPPDEVADVGDAGDPVPPGATTGG